MSQFKITKSQIEAYVNNGLTVKAMAEDISTKSGQKCSPATVKNACKTYGVNLRTKKRNSGFVFDDLELANPVVVNESTPHYTVATSQYPVGTQVHDAHGIQAVVEEAVVTL